MFILNYIDNIQVCYIYDNRSKEDKMKHMYLSGLNNLVYTVVSREHIGPHIEHIKVVI
jgi:hypothetical protein